MLLQFGEAPVKCTHSTSTATFTDVKKVHHAAGWARMVTLYNFNLIWGTSFIFRSQREDASAVRAWVPYYSGNKFAKPFTGF